MNVTHHYHTVCFFPPQECMGCPGVPERAPTSVTWSVKLWTTERTPTWCRNSKLLVCLLAVQNNGLFVLFDWCVALTGCCVCGYQPGAGTVLARPLKWRPVQEAQPLPGRHQSGEGERAAAALYQKQINAKFSISSDICCVTAIIFCVFKGCKWDL